jgi:hypothetical protein
MRNKFPMKVVHALRHDINKTNVGWAAWTDFIQQEVQKPHILHADLPCSDCLIVPISQWCRQSKLPLENNLPKGSQSTEARTMLIEHWNQYAGTVTCICKNATRYFYKL